jgi:hypothetical protein
VELEFKYKFNSANGELTKDDRRNLGVRYPLWPTLWVAF